MSEGEVGTTLEYTPTWVVAGVCTVIVAISLAAERVLHYTGVTLKRKNQKPLFEALQKVKEGLFSFFLSIIYLYSIFILRLFLFFFCFLNKLKFEFFGRVDAFGVHIVASDGVPECDK